MEYMASHDAIKNSQELHTIIFDDNGKPSPALKLPLPPYGFTSVVYGFLVICGSMALCIALFASKFPYNSFNDDCIHCPESTMAICIVLVFL